MRNGKGRVCSPKGYKSPSRRLKEDNTVVSYEDNKDVVQDFFEEVYNEGDRKKRSEEHTSELQSRQYLVCRLLLEKKKKKKYSLYPSTETTPISQSPLFGFLPTYLSNINYHISPALLYMFLFSHVTPLTH